MLIAVAAAGLVLGAAPSSCHLDVAKVPDKVLHVPAPSDPQAKVVIVRDPVATKVKNAQSAYERGLALYHAYDWIRAARSFNAAIRSDPNLASAWWGLSRVQEAMDDRTGARASNGRAKVLMSGASERERARIEAWEAALDGLDAADIADRQQAYRDALDAALAKWPDDAELLLMRGNAAAVLPPGYAPYQNAESVAFFERVLKKSPDHPGAHHYLVHALENDGKFDAAGKHGARVAALAPGAPHLVHMDGHGLLRRGKTAEAIAIFERVDALGASIRSAEKIDAAHDWHHSHNLALLASAYRHGGRMKDAEKTLRRLAEIAPAGEDALLDRKDLASFLLSRGRWEEALAAADSFAKSPLPETRAIAHAIAGEALLELGRRDDAKARLASAASDLDAIRGELAPTRTWIASLWTRELEMAIALADGNATAAGAVAAELLAKHRGLRGPDGWIQSTFRLERIAALARKGGAWDTAEAATRALAEHDPGYAGTHLALAALARHAGKADVALREEAAAKKAWAKADPGLL